MSDPIVFNQQKNQIVKKLPKAPKCKYYLLKQFHGETPKFCCSKWEIHLVCHPMSYDLAHLYVNDDTETLDFKWFIQSYHNYFVFATFFAKYNSEMIRNTKGNMLSRVF